MNKILGKLKALFQHNEQHEMYINSGIDLLAEDFSGSTDGSGGASSSDAGTGAALAPLVIPESVRRFEITTAEGNRLRVTKRPSVSIAAGSKGRYCFILYSDDFVEQAKYQERIYRKAGCKVESYLTDTKVHFKAAWERMAEVSRKADVYRVVMIPHSNGRAFMLTAGSSLEAYSVNGLNKAHEDIGDFRQLEDANIEELIIYSCNSGHLDLARVPYGNVATTFLQKPGIRKVISYDGGISYGYPYLPYLTKITGNYYPRVPIPSSEQAIFHDILGKLHLKERKPYGLLGYEKAKKTRV